MPAVRERKPKLGDQQNTLNTAPEASEPLRLQAPGAPRSERGEAHRPERPAQDKQRDEIQRDDKQRGAKEQKQLPAPKDKDRLTSWRERIRAYPFITAAAMVLVVAVLFAVVAWWLYARHFVSTDDAFVDARIATISSQVSGEITELAVTDNQSVEAGALIVRIDDRDYQASLAQAKAQVEQAAASVENFNAQINAQVIRIDQARHQVEQAQAALTFAQQENERAQYLLKQQAGTQQAAQQTASTLTQDQQALAAAQANQTAAEKQIEVLRSQRDNAIGQADQARAAQNQAETNLARTRIVAHALHS